MLRVLHKFGFEVVDGLADICHMALEKIVTLLGWHGVLEITARFGSHDTPFPTYA